MDSLEQDLLSVATLRMLAVDAIEKANSGHPGMALGAAPMAYVLWHRILVHNPRDPAWPNRDRFVLSAGHASALLYALLHLSGYDLGLEELEAFRQLGSRTPGHPEYRRTPGVEATTGPLGQGIGMAVGMAVAERSLADSFNQPGLAPLVDHHTYALLSDGDLMEGVAYEAASLAGHWQLGKLVCLYDANHVTIEGPLELAFSEDVEGRFHSCRWQVLKVADGEDLAAIEAALRTAQAETTRPTLIIVRTRIGFGSPKENDAASHGSPLGADAVAATRRRFGWPDRPFHVPETVPNHFRAISERGGRKEEEWRLLLEEYARRFPERLQEFQRRLAGTLPGSWESALEGLELPTRPLPSRMVSGMALNALSRVLPELWGGAADLGPSIGTLLTHEPERVVHFGLREHAMGAIVNGVALHGGLLPFCGTFLSFANYMFAAMRLSAVMGLKVVYVMSHDSIAVGEDGPTHQPVEHVAALRAMPGMVVIRPADGRETVAAWRTALEIPGPVTLILSRQPLPPLVDTPVDVARGAYIKVGADPDPDLILIASGSEVSLAVAAGQVLSSRRLRVRVVSMPSWELFLAQPPSYREAVLPPTITCRLAIEALASLGWHRWVGDSGEVLALDRFGVAAPYPEIMPYFGFSVEQIVDRGWSLWQRRAGKSGSGAE
ncbi:MAG: transketolase [Magnetococcales bacterium]|nr:transketolase [Magnetococcales bacterium]